jgi:hypothetical protein
LEFGFYWERVVEVDDEEQKKDCAEDTTLDDSCLDLKYKEGEAQPRHVQQK